jgi:hypothetical protein
MQLVNQRIYRGRCIPFCHRSQVGIYRGSGGAGVAEQSLDMPETQALFKQVCSEGVAKRMD